MFQKDGWRRHWAENGGKHHVREVMTGELEVGATSRTCGSKVRLSAATVENQQRNCLCGSPELDSGKRQG